MSKGRKILLIGFGVYVGVFLLLVVIYGFTQHKNNEFQIQNEFKLVDWVSLGPLSINRAVLYLFISAVLTIFTMVWIARRMQANPNKVQTAVEVVFSLMRANIFAGHIIILFMAGGLAVILGLQALGWFALPAGIIIYLFELGLVATLQAFIFATLAAIYIGGAASHH